MIGSAMACGRWTWNTLSSTIVEIGGESHRDRHVRDGVFEDQIPADDPREDLAQGRVGVGVRAAGDGNHRRQFRVAQRRETAHERGQQKRKRNARARARPPDRGDGVAAVQQQIQNLARSESIWTSTVSPAAAVPVRMKMPEPITAPMPNAVRLHGPSVLRSRLSGCSEPAISASMLRVRRSCRAHRNACAGPCTICLTFFFCDPRATPAARLAFGAAFLRAARFSFLRSVFS